MPIIEPSNKPDDEPSNKPNDESSDNSSIISTNKPILEPSDMHNLEPSKNSNVEQTNEINFEQTNIPDKTQNTINIQTKENIESNSTTVPSVINTESDSVPNTTIKKGEIPAIFGNESIPLILLGFSHFRMYDNSFLFYIYFSSINNNKFSRTITFPIIIDYNINIRLLKETQANCTLQEIKTEGKYQYLCEVYEDTKNIKQIKIEPNFNFGSNENFSLKGISPLASMFMDNIQLIDDKFDIISDSDVYIMDNCSCNKYGKYSFNISGEINDPQPKLENRNLTIIVNVESNKTKTVKEIECTINNITRTIYSLSCKANETFKSDFQSAMSFIDNNDILLMNFATANDSNISDINYQKHKNSFFHFRTNNGSLGVGRIIGLIVTLIVTFAITMITIVYLRKKNNKLTSVEESSIISIKKLENTKSI